MHLSTHHRTLRCASEQVELLRLLLSGPEIVRVQEGNQVAGRLREPAVQCRGQSESRLLHDAYWVAEPSRNVGGRVARPVVHHEHLGDRRGLAQDAVEGVAEIRRAVGTGTIALTVGPVTVRRHVLERSGGSVGNLDAVRPCQVVHECC